MLLFSGTPICVDISTSTSLAIWLLNVMQVRAVVALSGITSPLVTVRDSTVCVCVCGGRGYTQYSHPLLRVSTVSTNKYILRNC